jgi:hypothetical protein
MRSIPAERIDTGILATRGRRLVIDADLAEFHCVKTLPV